MSDFPFGARIQTGKPDAPAKWAVVLLHVTSKSSAERSSRVSFRSPFKSIESNDAIKGWILLGRRFKSSSFSPY